MRHLESMSLSRQPSEKTTFSLVSRLQFRTKPERGNIGFLESLSCQTPATRLLITRKSFYFSRLKKRNLMDASNFLLL